MRAEKQIITQEYLSRINASPFLIVANYRGLSVAHFNELRKRLNKAGAEIHVVKNSAFRLAINEAAKGAISELTGQLAMVTGRQDVSTAAKVLKTFKAEFDKPNIEFGYLGEKRLEKAELLALADLPSLEVLRGKLAGLVRSPATRLVQVLSAPGQQLARALQERVRKASEQP